MKRLDNYQFQFEPPHAYRRDTECERVTITHEQTGLSKTYEIGDWLRSADLEIIQRATVNSMEADHPILKPPEGDTDG